MSNQGLNHHTAGRQYLSPAECARRLNVAAVTLRKWARQGMLKAVVTPGGHRRYAVEEVRRFAAEYELPFQYDGDDATRVLIVDDDVQLCRYLSEQLRRCEPAPLTAQAQDGFEAGRLLTIFQPDIVLLDLMMPGMDGYQVCTAIKSHTATRYIRVIAMTGYYSEDNIQRIIQAGAEACLAKPINRDALLQSIGLNRHARR